LLSPHEIIATALHFFRASPHLVGVESFVAEKRAASDAVHELVDEIDVVTLAGNQDEGDEISQGVGECADLCRQSAA
jgi:hypothetical protein